MLLDTNVLSEPLRERPDPAVMEQLACCTHEFHTASVVIHEMSYGIQRLPGGRRQQRLQSYLQSMLTGGLIVLPYDSKAALWHGEQRARQESQGLRLPFVDGQIAAIAATQDLVLVTRNTRDFEGYVGLKLLNWFSHP
ncbi:MAG: type II toxin-antitoxin system VapC family toxin [Prochlorococcaceae cyanobacterium]